MDKSRIGYIEISNQMLEDFWLNNSEVVPLKCVDEKHKDSIRYLCWCKHFRDLNEGDLIPYYEFVFKINEKSGWTSSFNINEVEEAQEIFDALRSYNVPVGVAKNKT